MLILICLAVGLVASLVTLFIFTKGRDPGGGILPVMIGLTGSITGSFILRAIVGYGPVADLGGEPGQSGFYAGIVGAVVGASLLLFIYRVVASRLPRE